jgi:hypothetical protein
MKIWSEQQSALLPCLFGLSATARYFFHQFNNISEQVQRLTAAELYMPETLLPEDGEQSFQRFQVEGIIVLDILSFVTMCARQRVTVRCTSDDGFQ